VLDSKCKQLEEVLLKEADLLIEQVRALLYLSPENEVIISVFR